MKKGVSLPHPLSMHVTAYHPRKPLIGSALSPDGEVIVTGGRDDTLHLWNSLFVDSPNNSPWTPDSTTQHCCSSSMVDAILSVCRHYAMRGL
jgi:WD40 repeat protein